MNKTRMAVKRPSAETNIFISLVAFGLTVAVTRIFLEMAGYPQVGNSVLHIAHAIWGGLLLFVAVLVTLVLANRWAFMLSALLSGIGIGLFIDEVGKFITQKNDYFFAPAAPLIYSLFLLMILLFLIVRSSRRRKSPRSSMYAAVLGLREVLDNDLDTQERDRLLAELANGRSASEAHIRLLADQLSAYLVDDAVPVLAYRPGLWRRWQRQLRQLGERVGRKTHRRLIMGMTALIGLLTLLLVGFLVWAWLSPADADKILPSLLLTDAELTIQRPVWLVVRLVLQVAVGILYLFAWLLLWRGRENAGIDAAIFAALFSLTAVHLLNFYLNQFGALTAVFINFAFFLLLLAYRSWYLATDGQAAEG
jgi:hypothetical protein